jgi:F-type H+-transporting ATPase subunit b
MLLFILLVIAYGLLVRRPLERILTERHARTAGAMEQAKGAIAAAEAETGAYEEKLRKAKAEIFEARERRMKQWAAERETALEQVRQAAQERIGSVRQEVEQGAVEARAQIERTSAELSAKVIAAVLPANVAATEVAR